MAPPRVNIRYMVSDVDAALEFYTKHLGFQLISSMAPAFADVSRGELRLLLSGPTSFAGKAMPDGRKPEPGGWNRIQLVVDDLEERASTLRRAGVKFRGDIARNAGGAQVVIEDPSGNPLELFQPVGK